MKTGEMEIMNSIWRFQSKIDLKIIKLREKIYQKEGFIFVNHVHTQDALIEAPELEGITAIMQNIASNVSGWGNRNEGYSNQFIEAYQNFQQYNNDLFKEVLYEIVHRKPTTWEQIKKGLNNLFDAILQILPNLSTSYLENKRVMYIDAYKAGN